MCQVAFAGSLRYGTAEAQITVSYFSPDVCNTTLEELDLRLFFLSLLLRFINAIDNIILLPKREVIVFLLLNQISKEEVEPTIENVELRRVSQTDTWSTGVLEI